VLDLQKTAVSMRDLQGEEIWVSTFLWLVVVLSWELEGRREGGGGRWLVVGGGEAVR
jgi:hypothetical protein